MRTLVIARLLATHYAAALTPAGLRPRPQRGATRLASTRTDVRVLDHHLGGMMLDTSKLKVGDFLDAIASLEPDRVGSDSFGTPPLGTPGFDWDGSISMNTYTDYDTKHGPFTIHKYHEEWDSGTSVYAIDAASGKELMDKIVQCMRASGRYRGSLFDNDGEREERPIV